MISGASSAVPLGGLSLAPVGWFGVGYAHFSFGLGCFTVGFCICMASGLGTWITNTMAACLFTQGIDLLSCPLKGCDTNFPATQPRPQFDTSL
jgi:hypothetical protein